MSRIDLWQIKRLAFSSEMEPVMRTIKSNLLILFICLVLAGHAAAVNDGVFYSRGGTLIPLQETQISLRKEVLKFFVTDYQFMNVEVDFEFYNPGNEKSVIVGFVTPPASGDIGEDETAHHPRISEFTVRVNSKAIAFEFKRMSETSFKFDDREIYGTDYVYYFPVTFKPGFNKIRHTYRFQGGASVEHQRYFDYQITTGKRWANKQIDDFELQIHLDRGIFFVPLSFRKTGQPANWEIIGRGSFSKPQTLYFGEESPNIKLVQIQNGYLSLKQTDFRPDRDIGIGEYHWNVGSHTKMCNNIKSCPKVTEVYDNLFQYFRVEPSEYFSEDNLAELSRDDLAIVRNFPYAIRGYPFKSPMIKRFYSQFFWYLPDQELKITDITLSKSEEEFVKKILNVEKRK